MSPPSPPTFRPANRGTATKETPRGLLYLEFSEGQVVALRPAPAVAWNKRQHRPTWRGTAFPGVHVGELIRHIRAERSITAGLSRRALPDEDRPPMRPYEMRRRQNFARFLQEVPPAVEEELAHRYPSCDWQLLRVLRASERAREACQAGDRALVYALTVARHLVNDAPRRTLPFVERWLRRPRRQALARLGFPARPLSARVLRRLELSHADPSTLAALRHTLGHPKAARVLAHLPRVNAGVARLVQPSFLGRVSTALLEEVLAIPSGFRFPHGSALLSHILRLEEQVDARSRPRFASLATLRDWHDDLVEKARLQAISGDEPFPEPPVALEEDEEAWVHPLPTGAALAREGELMHHCLGTLREHHELARRGRFYAWALQGDERATVALVKRRDVWRLYDVRTFANGPVSPGLTRWARRLLFRAREEESASTEPFYDAPYEDDLPF